MSVKLDAALGIGHTGNVSPSCLESLMSIANDHSPYYQTRQQLEAGLEHIRLSPRDRGRLEMIVVRPKKNARLQLEVCDVSPDGGIDGDNWAIECWKTLPDGKSDPNVQVTLINSRLAQLVATERSRWPLAGDQLYVDLDLSYENLPVGQRFALGTAEFEITAEPHTGCQKFIARYGTDALAFVNRGEGKRLNLRGIYAKVIRAGVVRVGDEIRKL